MHLSPQLQRLVQQELILNKEVHASLVQKDHIVLQEPSAQLLALLGLILIQQVEQVSVAVSHVQQVNHVQHSVFLTLLRFLIVKLDITALQEPHSQTQINVLLELTMMVTTPMLQLIV